MKRNLTLATLFAALAVGIAGCSSGGGGTSSSSNTPPPGGGSPPSGGGTPAIEVLPTTPPPYDFGRVTTSNSPAPLEVTIKNKGTGPLVVSGISLPSNPDFTLRLSGGSKPCGSASPTIAAADSCTVQVAFQPVGTGLLSSTLQISSNDATKPVIGLSVAGTSEAPATLTVRINQLETTCPAVVTTAYVSVTDQGGYAVTGLLATNFSVAEGTPGTSLPIIDFSYANAAYTTVAISGVLDYSDSLTGQVVAFADMKTGFSNLFASLRAGDIGEVVKFGSEFEVVQTFTPDKAQLLASIAAPFSKGGFTKLYDAVFQAVDDTAIQTSFRKAVVVATDGQDNASVHTLAQVIANATSKKVPVFVIGIGASINRTALEQMATQTGGLFYEASVSQNLATIYKQLTSLLYENQYVLKFDQLALGAAGTPSPLTIRVNAFGIAGSDLRTISSCN